MEIIFFSKSAKRIALGLSGSSWELLQRLLYRKHADHLALPPGAASTIKNPPKELWIDSPTEIFKENWGPESTFLVVGAVGAVIRIIAPLLTTKTDDPAVLVMDSRAENIIPLIGGHKAGAEELAFHLSEEFGGNIVLTGFSSMNEMLPIDSFGTAWGWKRNGDLKKWNELMIQQSKSLPIKFFQQAGSTLWQSSKGAFNSLFAKGKLTNQECLSFEISSDLTEKCSWHPPVLWVGIGCERNTSLSLLEKALQDSLRKAGLAKSSIAGFASIEIKSDEPALTSLISKEALPVRFYSAQELSEVEVPNPSAFVQSEVGTSSVAEAASILSAGKGAKLKLEKQIFQSKENGAATIAIAESVEPFAPDRGEIHLVGSGPGELSFLTQDARFALSRSAVWVGYKRYLDLLEPFRRHDQVRMDGSLTRERDRCQEALKLAVQGVRVALISSGDSGIYGMAGLALELWLELPQKSRPRFEVHPGITALQFAAAKAGAPLMHDFCAISLSDCLTSWEKIEERLIAAAKGDFVIALYNPRSKDRFWQLGKALEIFLQYLPANTPILLARQLGRSEETIATYLLGDFPIEKVDMLSVVLVGNSSTYVQDGYWLTPRGY
nr:precorrin-3B C(17)-methyltransferase [Prochlorococcus marinus]